MAPWLVANLAPDGPCKPRAPRLAGEGLVHAVAGVFVYEISEIGDAFVLPDVVVQGGQLDKLAEEGDSSVDAHLKVVSEEQGIYRLSVARTS